MADYSSFDLFSEIEDICRLVDDGSESQYDFVGKKKCGNKFDFVELLDEDIKNNIDMCVGIPSHGILDSDKVLADVSSNTLLGDPLLNFFEQNELLELQSASHSHNPETLMPVSLPADPSPLPSIAPDSASFYSAGEKQPTPFLSPNIEPSVLRSRAQCITVKTDSLPETSGPKPITVKTDSTDSRSFNSSHDKAPVRIIVKTQQVTQQNPTPKMVAPVNLQKPPRSLVKIPRAVPVIEGSRLRVLKSGGKVGPSAEKNSSSNTLKNAPHIPHTPSLIQEPAPVTSPSVEAADNVNPFRSLRTRHSSDSSEGSCTYQQGVKRKAYELGPQNDPNKERCRQNAINAKRNRETKKAHMQELERRVETISRERDELAGENESLREAKEKLEQQVKHLENVLHNQSQLSSLIDKLRPTNVVLGDMVTSEEEVMSSGMCLHVDGEEATIEYCSFCAKKAGKKFPFAR